MNKSSRRNLLKGVSLGAGAVALSPFLRSLESAEKQVSPRRFVFVVKSSGLQGDYLNPEGLEHRGAQLVDESLEGRKLPESLVPLEPFRNKLTIIQGLSGKMTRLGHSAHYGALGGYKASPHAPPLAATIDGHLSETFPSVFNHVGFKMGEGSQGVTFPAISAKGKGQQLPFQQNPVAAFENLFGSILEGGDLKKKYTRTGNVLDAMSDEDHPGTADSHERDRIGRKIALNGRRSAVDRIARWRFVRDRRRRDRRRDRRRRASVPRRRSCARGAAHLCAGGAAPRPAGRR